MNPARCSASRVALRDDASGSTRRTERATRDYSAAAKTRAPPPRRAPRVPSPDRPRAREAHPTDASSRARTSPRTPRETDATRVRSSRRGAPRTPPPSPRAARLATRPRRRTPLCPTGRRPPTETRRTRERPTRRRGSRDATRLRRRRPRIRRASFERGERGGVRANHHRHRRRRGSPRGDSRRVDRRRGPRPDAHITPRRYFHRTNRREARVVLGRRPRDEVPRAKRVRGGATRLPSDDVREEVRRVGRDATQKRRRAVRPVVRVVVRFRRASRGGRGRERGAHRGDDGEVRGFVRGLSRRRLEHVHRRRGRYPRPIPSDVAAASDEFGDASSGERDDGVVRSTDIVQRRRGRFRSTREGLRARRGTHARRHNRQRLPRRAGCVSGRVARRSSDASSSSRIRPSSARRSRRR